MSPPATPAAARIYPNITDRSPGSQDLLASVQLASGREHRGRPSSSQPAAVRWAANGGVVHKWTQVGLALFAGGVFGFNPAPASGARLAMTGPVVVNDNTRPAGVLRDGTLTLRLRAAAGRWQPEGPDGPALTVDAFGEEGADLNVPAPLIRVTEGVTIAVSIRNQLATTLRVHGLCARDGNACAPVDVPPGGTREVRFAGGRPGTYHYWATTMNAPVPFRELAGALVIDSRDGRGRGRSHLRDHRVDQPDAGPARGDRHGGRRQRGLPGVATEGDVRHQRSVVAGDRAVDVSPRRGRALACDQPQLADAPDAPPWVLFHRHAGRQRTVRRARRRRRGPPGRDARCCRPGAR